MGSANGNPRRCLCLADPQARPLLTDSLTGRLMDYLVGVVHQGAVVTVVAHAVAVGVSLVRVVDVGTIVALVEDICRYSKEREARESREGTLLFLSRGRPRSR